MAIEKRGNKYRTTVSINGVTYRGTFDTLKEAKLFARCPLQEKTSSGITFKQLILRYFQEVARFKKSSRQQQHRVNIIIRSSLGKEMIDEITVDTLDKFFEERLKTKTNNQPYYGCITESTVKKDRELISATFNYAIRRGLLERNPVHGSMKLKGSPPRERIASPKEIELLCKEVKWQRGNVPTNATQRVICAFVLSTLTGMRLGEICAIERDWVFEKYITLPATVTKTSKTRDVALSTSAREMLNLVLSLNFEKVFNLEPSVASALFRKVRDRAGLREQRDKNGNLIKQGLHFHDARATFCTNAAKVLPPLTLARQLGHSDMKMTMRYYRESADRIADMLG